MSAALSIVLPQQTLPPAGSLFEIRDHLQALFDTLDMVEDPDQRREIEAEIQRYMDAEVHKVDGLAWYMAHLESQVEGFYPAEIKRLQAGKARAQRTLDRIEDYCIAIIEKLPEPKRGPRKLEGQTSTLSISPSEGVVIADESLIPSEFKTAVVEMPAAEWEQLVAADPSLLNRVTKHGLKARPADVKKALKAGRAIDGADLEDRWNLRRA